MLNSPIVVSAATVHLLLSDVVTTADYRYYYNHKIPDRKRVYRGKTLV